MPKTQKQCRAERIQQAADRVGSQAKLDVAVLGDRKQAGTVSAWCSQDPRRWNSPSAEHYRLIAAAADVSVDWLLALPEAGDTDPPELSLSAARQAVFKTVFSQLMKDPGVRARHWEPVSGGIGRDSVQAASAAVVRALGTPSLVRLAKAAYLAAWDTARLEEQRVELARLRPLVPRSRR